MKLCKRMFRLRTTLLALLALVTIGVFAQNEREPFSFLKTTPNSAFTSSAQKNSATGKTKHAALKTWTSSFIYSGQMYPYTMVGTNPANGSVTTTIPVTIIPLQAVFGNVAYDGAAQVTKVIASPIFQNAPFESGDTQYIDAIQRAEFWQVIQKHSSTYHVLLQKPTVVKSFTLEIPADYGGLIMMKGHQYGNLNNRKWWKQQLQHILDKYQASSNGLTIFLTNNILINREEAGFHDVEGAGEPGDTTYVWATLFEQSLAPKFADVAPLSHELAEWANNPYTHNNVPPYILPGQLQYGCMRLLEVADPLVGTVFTINGFTFQDAAFFSWFARQPSLGYKGYYSYLDTFKIHLGILICS